MPIGAVKVASGGIAVSQSPAGYGAPFILAPTGVAITVVASGGLGIADAGSGIFALPVTYSTWDPATITAVTLSGGNLVATNTGTTSADQGAKGVNASGKTSGKYYFEITVTTYLNGVCAYAGICTTAATYSNVGGNNAQGGVAVSLSGGAIGVNGSSSGGNIGSSGSGTIFGVAVDLDNRKCWIRKSPAGNWNASGTADPPTNIGGNTIVAGTIVPVVTFGCGGGVANNVYTANFGASAFNGAVPSGFTAGWPS